MDGNGNDKRVVLYARTSGDDRGSEGRNLASQLEMAREYARRKGYAVVAEIQEDDRGASGAAFELEGLNRVLEMAQDGAFDVLVPREIDRLSRSLAKQLVVEEELKRHGVEVEYVLGSYPDTPEGRLNKHIRATIAEFEREKVIERTVRGRFNKVRAGNVMVHGVPPYGYRVGEENGKTMLVVHESEARIIRLIFEWYVQGDGEGDPLSFVKIARKLSGLGVPTHADIHGRYKKRGPGAWNTSVVHRIIKNETYAGTWRYGKKRRRDGKWTPNAQDQTLAVEVPAIVDRETWEAAQAQRGENRVNALRNTKHEYLLGRRVTCGGCGLKMTSMTVVKDGVGRYSYYLCPARERGRQDYARECNAPLFRADEVDAGAWEWVVELLTDRESLRRGFREYQAEREQENEPLRARVAVVDDLLAANRTQLELLLDLYLAGDFSRETLTDRKVRLEKTISALEEQRAGLVSRLQAGALTDGQIQTLEDFVGQVGQGLDVMRADFGARRSVIEALNVQAVLAVENGQKVVHARCVVGDEVYNLRPAESLV